MKSRLVLILTLFMIFECGYVYSQGFKPPSDGKAVVYLVRTGTYAKKYEFEIFKDDKLLCELKGENYLRVECEPGHHLFWVDSENHDYVDATLEAGKTYIVRALITMGAFSSRLYLTPIVSTDKEKFDPAYSLITKTAPFVPEAKDLEKMNKKKAKMIRQNLERYNSLKAENKLKSTILSADMAIPADAMK